MDSDDNKPKRGHGLLTPMQNRFVEFFDGNATEAARLAGYKNPNMIGPRLMQNKMVVAAIQAKMAIRLEAQAKKEGEVIAQANCLKRAEHMEILAEIARDKNAPPQARIGAVMGSAELLGMRVKQTRSLTEKFEGFTEAELEQYSKDGTVPERFAIRFGIAPGGSTQVM